MGGQKSAKTAMINTERNTQVNVKGRTWTAALAILEVG